MPKLTVFTGIFLFILVAACSIGVIVFMGSNISTDAAPMDANTVTQGISDIEGLLRQSMYEDMASTDTHTSINASAQTSLINKLFSILSVINVLPVAAAFILVLGVILSKYSGKTLTSVLYRKKETLILTKTKIIGLVCAVLAATAISLMTYYKAIRVHDTSSPKSSPSSFKDKSSNESKVLSLSHGPEVLHNEASSHQFDEPCLEVQNNKRNEKSSENQTDIPMVEETYQKSVIPLNAKSEHNEYSLGIAEFLQEHNFFVPYWWVWTWVAPKFWSSSMICLILVFLTPVVSKIFSILSIGRYDMGFENTMLFLALGLIPNFLAFVYAKFIEYKHSMSSVNPVYVI